MKRTIKQWQNCDPNAMAHNQSDAAKFFAFEDAKADILELYAENKRIRRIMHWAQSITSKAKATRPMLP